MAAILRDITLLKHLDQMKNDFVNTVSHDLKNPISVIDGTAEIISWKAQDDPALQRRVQRIRDEARFMAELVVGSPRSGKDRGRARPAEGTARRRPAGGEGGAEDRAVGGGQGRRRWRPRCRPRPGSWPPPRASRRWC